MTDETARPTDEGAPISTTTADDASVERALRAGLTEFELSPEDEALLSADGPLAGDEAEQGLVLRAELEVVEPRAQGSLHGGVVDDGGGGRDRSALVDGAGGLVSHGVLESVNVSGGTILHPRETHV